MQEELLEVVSELSEFMEENITMKVMREVDLSSFLSTSKTAAQILRMIKNGVYKEMDQIHNSVFSQVFNSSYTLGLRQ